MMSSLFKTRSSSCYRRAGRPETTSSRRSGPPIATSSPFGKTRSLRLTAKARAWGRGGGVAPAATLETPAPASRPIETDAPLRRLFDREATWQEFLRSLEETVEAFDPPPQGAKNRSGDLAAVYSEVSRNSMRSWGTSITSAANGTEAATTSTAA